MNAIQDSIGYLLAQLCKTHRYAADASLNEIGLYVGQEMILTRLWEQDGQSQTQLAGVMCVEPPTVTKMLARMERVGLVERRADPNDARVSRVYLTDESRRIQPQVGTVWGALEGKLLNGLTDTDQALLRALLQRLLDNLQAE